MKYLLLLTFLLTPYILNNKSIVDLDNRGRQGSKYIRDLNWIPNIKVTESVYSSHSKYSTDTNQNIKFGLPVQTTGTISVSADIPTLIITPINNEQDFLKYSLSYKTSKECLMFNHPEKVKNSVINCEYKNGRYTTLTKTFINKNYKKEVPIAKRYVIGLTHQGDFEVGHIINNQVFYGFYYDYPGKVEDNFRIFEGKVIKDLFTGEESYLGVGTLFILTEDELITARYSTVVRGINFEKLNTLNVKDLQINLTGLKQVFYLEKQYFFVLRDGFYLLKASADKWEINYISKLSTINTEVELNDIEAIVYKSYLCFSIKGLGLIIVDNNLNVIRIFEHKYIDRVVTTKHSKGVFNIGFSVDNQSNKNVNEFFIELSIFDNIDKLSEIFLNRVFISSNEVKAVQTDTLGYVVTFLIGTDVFIVPRAIYGLNNLLVYAYKNVDISANLGFIYIDNNDEKYNFMFRLTKLGEEENKIVSLYTTVEDNESFTCNFKKEGDYLVKSQKQYLNCSGEQAIRTIKFDVHVSQSTGRVILKDAKENDEVHKVNEGDKDKEDHKVSGSDEVQKIKSDVEGDRNIG
jgi:hypothetical protein